MKDNHFKLSNSFTNLLANKQQPTKRKQHSSSNSLNHGLFKLNPASAHQLKDIPVQILRKKSKNKLESLKDQANKSKSFSIFNQKIQNKSVVTEPIKNRTKKYDIDMGNLNPSKNMNKKQEKVEAELPYDIVPPSRIDQLTIPPSQDANCTIFQTPILPCFASQFRQNINNMNATNINQQGSLYKCIEEKEGVWKIGKIKIKGNKAKIVIGGIQFQAIKADVAGRAGVVSQQNQSFYSLRNWRDIWVTQPSEELFK